MADITPAQPTANWYTNAAYRAAVTVGLAVGFARIGKLAGAGAPPKLDFTARDLGYTSLYVGLAAIAQDYLIKQGIIPKNIVL